MANEQRQYGVLPSGVSATEVLSWAKTSLQEELGREPTVDEVFEAALKQAMFNQTALSENRAQSLASRNAETTAAIAA